MDLLWILGPGMSFLILLVTELFTPLMAACASTRENEEQLVAVVDLLLNYDVDVNAVERHRISALMFAAKEGHERLVRRLAQHRTGCNLNLQDSQGWTVSNRQSHIINYLELKQINRFVRRGSLKKIIQGNNQNVMGQNFAKWCF